MRSKYLLKINYDFRHNVKYISSFDLIIDDRIRRRIMDDKIINYIENMIRLENPKKKKINDEIYISDEDFIKNHVPMPSKKISKENNYAKKIGLITTLGLSFISTIILDHKINPNLYNSSNTSSTLEDDFEEVNINNEKEEEIKVSLDDIDTPIVFSNETDEGIKISYFSDKDDNVNEEVLTTNTITSFDNIYKYNIECEDLSDDELLNFIKETYKVPIYLCSRKYGKDPNWVAAKIRRENPYLVVRDESCDYGYGTLQLEKCIWEDVLIEDIDGSSRIIDFNKVNNISENHVNMDKVSYYINNNCNIESLEELYNLNPTDDELNKYNITLDDLEKYKNFTYGLEFGLNIWHLYDKEIMENNKNNEYNYTLSDEECILISDWAYNKGINCINNCLYNSNSFEETITKIKSTDYGDNEYDKNTFCYIGNDTIICDNNIYIMTNLQLQNTISK